MDLDSQTTCLEDADWVHLHTHKPRSAPRLHVKMCQSTKRAFNTEHYVRLDIYLKSFMEGIVAVFRAFTHICTAANSGANCFLLLHWLLHLHDWLDNSCALSRKCFTIQGEGKAFPLYSSPLGLRSRLQAGLHSWPTQPQPEKPQTQKNCWK